MSKSLDTLSTDVVQTSAFPYSPTVTPPAKKLFSTAAFFATTYFLSAYGNFIRLYSSPVHCSPLDLPLKHYLLEHLGPSTTLHVFALAVLFNPSQFTFHHYFSAPSVLSITFIGPPGNFQVCPFSRLAVLPSTALCA
jgi:hypothetical protein